MERRATTCRRRTALLLSAAALLIEPPAYADGSDAGAEPRGAEAGPVEVHVVGDAVRDRAPPKDPGVAGSVIPRARLAGPGLTAEDALRTQPGVVVTESGGFGAPSTAAVRGATAADTPVYLAGVRLNDDVAGTADLSLVPLWLIDRIEIYRGNAPLEADRLGPGGAIFFEPRKPNKSMGGVGYSGGSWGASKGWAFEGVSSRGVSALVGVSVDASDNRYPFVDDHGELFEPGAATLAVRQNADEKTLTGWAIARVALNPAEEHGPEVEVIANGIARDQGVPSLALLPTLRAREESSRALGSMGVRIPVGSGDRLIVDSRTSVLIGQSSYQDPLLELALSAKSLHIQGTRVEQSLGATLHMTENVSLRPVVDASHEQIERDPGALPLDHARREFGRIAMGAQVRASDGLIFRALASGECHHTGAKEGETCDVLEPTGRVGVEAGFGPFRLLGNLGRYVRVPTLGEVYGVTSAVHGNPNLLPETGETVDAGLRVATSGKGPFDGAFLDTFAFARWAQGLIAYERAGQGYVIPYNVGSARVVGAEFLGSAGFLKILHAELSSTLLDPRDTSTGRTTRNDILPYRSRFIASPALRVDWKIPNARGVSGLGGELRALYQSSRYVDPAGLGLIDEQTTVDAEVQVAWFDGLLTVRFRVADIFDARRTDTIGYPLPGRSAYFGAEATW